MRAGLLPISPHERLQVEADRCHGKYLDGVGAAAALYRLVKKTSEVAGVSSHLGWSGLGVIVKLVDQSLF